MPSRLLCFGTDLVSALILDEGAVVDQLLQGGQERGIIPLLVRWHARLHGLLNGNGGGSGTVLEASDGCDDSF